VFPTLVRGFGDVVLSVETEYLQVQVDVGHCCTIATSIKISERFYHVGGYQWQQSKA
jgi:hypothetical protein